MLDAAVSIYERNYLRKYPIVVHTASSKGSSDAFGKDRYGISYELRPFDDSRRMLNNVTTAEMITEASKQMNHR